MRININLSALGAFTSLNATNKALQKSILRLSSGLRINSAADDAAGFAVSEKMRSQISGLDSALRNAQDGMSMLQTAEGGLGEANSILQRMRELSVQAASDTLTSQDRKYLQLEIEELRDQIDRIAGTTEFNNKKLLDGSCGAMWSASDGGLKAKIHGGLEYADEFGQKVSSEGNYKIEVTAEPGQPQVQKSNIFNLDELQEVKKVEYVPVQSYEVPSIIDDDVLDEITEKIEIETISAGDSGKGWNFDGNTLLIEESGSYNIVGTDQTIIDRSIKVSGLAKATVFMSNVSIDRSSTSGCAFELEDGAEVDMYLRGNNYLSSGKNRAGIEAAKGTYLAISSISGEDSTDGTLEVHGGDYAAGIGGTSVNSSEKISSGSIIITGGTIKAYGGNQSAGIGGASLGSPGGGGEVTITGGNIEAYGGRQGAGIGSGHGAYSNPDTLIKIAGGHIRAYGGTASSSLNGAGIGGGCHSDSGTILIKEGLIDWLDKENGLINPATKDTAAIYAERGMSSVGLPINTSQDIGHGTDSQGTTGTLDEQINISVALKPSLITRHIPVTITDMTTRPTAIRDMNIFYNSEGVFLVEHPQTLTISQGNGKTAEVTLYPEDTISDVAERINNAIADGLGQKDYVNATNKFCTIAEGPAGTSESVYVQEKVYRPKYQRDDYGNLVLDENNNPIVIGREDTGKKLTYSTMLVRSVIPGKEGELSFSGDLDLLNALGLNTIQESSESTLTASVYDAHSGKTIATNVKASGTEFTSLIPPDIDIEVDSMAGLSANWDEHTKRFIMASKDVYSAFLHLKNNGSIFQLGSNGGEDFSVQLADISSSALGLSRVNVITRENASRSISLIDSAIHTIAEQRARVGADSNSLERAASNLTTTSINLTDADSRLRDADIASTMMDFVKLQILNQSGTSMLAQANQLPQSIMSLYQQ